jgi:hypothetical protein
MGCSSATGTGSFRRHPLLDIWIINVRLRSLDMTRKSAALTMIAATEMP